MQVYQVLQHTTGVPGELSRSNRIVAHTFILKGLSGRFIRQAGEFLKSALERAVVSEDLGRCMDDITLDSIPTTWPLVIQAFLIVRVLGSVYGLAERSVSDLVFEFMCCG